MFIANFADGTTVRERLSDSDQEGVYWDDLPDKPITALHLTLPVEVKARQSDGSVVSLPPPVVSLSPYNRYYFANQAVSTIFSMQGGGVGGVGGGEGIVTHQIIAGIDDEHDLVVWIEVDRKANVVVKRFPTSQLKVRPEVLKQGLL
jgi:hypothetical protein